MLRSCGFFFSILCSLTAFAVEVKPEINGTMDSTCRTAGNCAFSEAAQYSAQVMLDGDYITFQDISVQDSAYQGIYIHGDHHTVENTEVGWCGMGCIRANSQQTGQLIQNNTVHHGPYAYYAANVLSETQWFGGSKNGGPPLILASVMTSKTAPDIQGTAAGNRVYTGYREGIGCFRAVVRTNAGSSCWVVGNVVSGIRVVSIYAATTEAIIESNISYNATDDDWYSGDSWGGYNAAAEQGGIGYDDNTKTFFRNNLGVNLSSCFDSIHQKAARDNDPRQDNALKVHYGTCVTTSNNDGAAYRIAQSTMIQNEFKNSIGYAASATKQCDQAGTITVDTNFWDSAVSEAACSDAGDIIGSPSITASLSATYTTASPPSAADYEYTGAGVDGVGDATPLTTTVFDDEHFFRYSEVTWWDDQGYTKPSLAQLKKQSDVDFMGVDRDDTNPDIGAFEF
jgi:hypothetical protein